MVSNHLKDVNKEYEFRIANKCRAGFINIHDSKGTSSEMMRGWSKNSLVNIQVKNEFGQWMNVYTTKGGKWHSIDKGFMDVLTVITSYSIHYTKLYEKNPSYYQGVLLLF